MQNIYIGEFIRQRRKELNLSQEDLAYGICEVSTLSRIENGRCTPSRSKINALLQRLGLPEERYYAIVSKNEKEIEALQQKVIDLFGEPFDDRVERSEAAPSIREIAKALDTTPLTVRKMLITAGYYSTKHSRKVQELYEQGCTIQEIMDQTGLKRASVHGYLPYTKGNYNLPELPLNAERRRVYRRRIAVCERLMREINSPNAEECLWDAIVAFAGYPFVTEKGLPLKYTLEGGEIFFNRKEKSVTRATVMRAFHQARTIQESEGCVSGPKKLGTFGASYLYPVFLRIGVCSKKSEIF